MFCRVRRACREVFKCMCRCRTPVRGLLTDKSSQLAHVCIGRTSRSLRKPRSPRVQCWRAGETAKRGRAKGHIFATPTHDTSFQHWMFGDRGWWMLLLSTSTSATVCNLVNNWCCERLSFNRRKCFNNVDLLCVLEGRACQLSCAWAASHAGRHDCRCAGCARGSCGNVASEDTAALLWAHYFLLCETVAHVVRWFHLHVHSHRNAHPTCVFSLQNKTNQLICIKQSTNHITNTD